MRDRGQKQRANVGLDLGELLTDAAFADRFWSKVDTSGDCWLWTAHTKPSGYGQFTITKGVFTVAHRVAFALSRQTAIALGAHICHTCDNPPCVRPDHLFLGDARINALDASAKGRMRTAIGVDHRDARLDEHAVRRIRATPAYLGVLRDLSAEYGVSPTAIRNVRLGRTWRHVA